ncbi:DUF1232 domain-containing protein [Micromonospora sp. SH-82]|uniref:DUF1232 domain-containing protein n=1 Tax=Micromonospora sp. SH-82 TaxID=3132938 RepID=UPI003EB84056
MSQETWLFVVLGGVLAVATLVGAALLAFRLWKTRQMLGALGAKGKVAFYGALAYTILPVDLLPDPIYLDDIGVLAAALLYLARLARKRGDANPTDSARPVSAAPDAGRLTRPVP